MAHLANKNDSRIKMVALTDENHENIVWYSPVKQNNCRDEVIINGMLSRFLKRKESNSARVIQFYDNDSKELISERKC